MSLTAVTAGILSGVTRKKFGGSDHVKMRYILAMEMNKKGQLSLTNPRDACETFARFT